VVDPAYCQLLARYNRWINERLYAVVGAFDEAARLAPTRHVFPDERLPWLHTGAA